MASSSSGASATIGLGMELLMLGLATGIASLSDEMGTMMLVFMAGLFLLWLMYHARVTSAIPNLLKLANQKG